MEATAASVFTQLHFTSSSPASPTQIQRGLDYVDQLISRNLGGLIQSYALMMNATIRLDLVESVMSGWCGKAHLFCAHVESKITLTGSSLLPPSYLVSAVTRMFLSQRRRSILRLVDLSFVGPLHDIARIGYKYQGNVNQERLEQAVVEFLTLHRVSVTSVHWLTNKTVDNNVELQAMVLGYADSNALFGYQSTVVRTFENVQDLFLDLLQANLSYIDVFGITTLPQLPSAPLLLDSPKQGFTRGASDINFYAVCMALISISLLLLAYLIGDERKQQRHLETKELDINNSKV
jgi:hypothetical protein